MRAPSGLLGRCRSPVAASAARQAVSASASPSVKVAEVTTSPCAGCATASANGFPGSIQLRLTATSVSALSLRSSASHSTVSGPGGSARSRNSRLHAASCMSARRSSPRTAASRRWRIPGSGGFSASSSGRRNAADSRRSAPASRSKPAASRTPASTRPSIGGRASASIPYGESPNARAITCCRTSARKLSAPGRPRPSPTR